LQLGDVAWLAEPGGLLGSQAKGWQARALLRSPQHLAV